MGQVLLASQEFLGEERRPQMDRIEAAERRLEWGKRLALIGGPLIALFSLSVSVMVIRGIRRPVRVITRAMTSLGSGDLDQRITDRMGSREFNRLAQGYNQMADRLATASDDQRRSERELKQVHHELLSSSQVLRQRGEVIELLGGMAHRMQAARTEAELAQVIHAFVPRVLPGLPGCSMPTTTRATCWSRSRPGATMRATATPLGRTNAGLCDAARAISSASRGPTSSATTSGTRTMPITASRCWPRARSSASCI